MVQRHIEGFSLLEVIVVIIIVGILASLALPRFFSNVERMRAEEGRRVLMDLLMAQKHYHLENGSYAENIGDLDISYSIAPDNFFDPDDSDISSADPIARVRRRDGSYSLGVTEKGIFSCTGTADSCEVILGALNN